MKKFFAVILTVLLCLSLCACGESGGKTKSVEEKVKDTVQSRIEVDIMLQYGITSPSITYYINQIGENTFEVTGKVNVRDKYGDVYTGNYSAVVDYDLVTDKCDVNCNISKLYKK